jgi:uncharacterized protein
MTQVKGVVRMPFLSRIYIYPFKSLDGIAIESATILASGALAGDRAFALFDEQGLFINGKRNSRVHLLRSFFNSQERTLSLRVQDTEQGDTFQVDTERERLNAWLSDFFARPVSVQENTLNGFPDDTQAPGPTLIGAASLREVASWFPELDEQATRPRFRANLEIDDASPFWEDQLYAEAGEVVQFRIGDVVFEGMNPCQRCIVPSRDPHTANGIPSFQKIFMERRKESLPSWATRSRFNHFYRLSINTRVPASQAGKLLRVGDPVVLGT